MEDDADLRPGFGPAVRKFFDDLKGESWDCLMVGGQHHSEPALYKPGVYRAAGPKGIQRTHCMAFTHNFMRELYKFWSLPLDQHCDWALGPFATKFKTFAPEKFLVGQRGGLSRITLGNKPPEWWNAPNQLAPIVMLKATREVLERCRDILHSGNRRNPQGVCLGLWPIFSEPVYRTREARKTQLKQWTEMILWEAESMPNAALATIWHPRQEEELAKELFGDRLRIIEANTVQEARDAFAKIREEVPASGLAITVPPRTASDVSSHVNETLTLEEGRRGQTPATTPPAAPLSAFRPIFDRVQVINLARRPERWQSFLRGVQQVQGWPWVVERFQAIDGAVVPPPKLWEGSAGNGAFGCWASHVRILMDAIADGVQTLAVFEDDAAFMPDFADRFIRFWKSLPDDWDGLLLGCQHVDKPIPVNDEVVRAMGPQRTHALVYRPRWMKGFLREILSWNSHIDWKMQEIAPQFKLYAPTVPLVIQDFGNSDIDGRVHAKRGWHGKRIPHVLHLTCPREVMEELSLDGFTTGIIKDGDGVDRGLRQALSLPERLWRVRKLRAWFADMSAEAASTGKGVLSVWMPNATEDELSVLREVFGQEWLECPAQTREAIDAFVKPLKDAI
jgi:hypothetical protein